MPTLSFVDALGEARTLEVVGPLVIGREEACDVFLAEKKASRRHARLAQEESGAWMLEDLESANGTFVGDAGAGEVRILRRRLGPTEVLRIGDSRLEWHDEPAVLVGGRLALRNVSSTQAAPVAASSGAPAAPPAEPERELEPEQEPALAAAPPAPTYRALDTRAFGRGLALFLVGVTALAVVGKVLGDKAARATQETQARRALADLIAHADVDAQAFESEALHFLTRYPESADRALVQRHLDAVRARRSVRLGVEARFETLMARLGSLPEDQLRGQLLALRRDLTEDEGLTERVRLALVELDRRRAAYEREQGEQARVEAAALVAQGQPGEALRALTSYRAARGLLGASEEALAQRAEEETVAAVRALAVQVLAAARAEASPTKRLHLLTAAYPALAGTFAEADLADALRAASRPPRLPSGPSSSPGGPTTEPSAAADALLARGAEAERLFAARRWVEARGAFELSSGK